MEGRWRDGGYEDVRKEKDKGWDGDEVKGCKMWKRGNTRKDWSGRKDLRM